MSTIEAYPYPALDIYLDEPFSITLLSTYIYSLNYDVYKTITSRLKLTTICEITSISDTTLTKENHCFPSLNSALQ